MITFQPDFKSALTLLVWLWLTGCSTAKADYFTLQFVDKETGRGVPLVQVETTNRVRYISDSAGRIAIKSGALGSPAIYFDIRSDGYQLPGNDQGSQGITVTLAPGKTQTVPLHRINIAQRLYRVTGEGIYYDSQLVGASTPLPYQQRPKGGVFGQDSVANALYNNKLYWFWGDTRRADGPLGNFKVSGAVSPLPEASPYDPSDAVDLTYFAGEDGFVRQMCPFPGEGAIWIDGLLVIEENQREHMLCGYARISPSFEQQEIGLARWNDDKEEFEKLVEFPLGAPLTPRGLPLEIVTDGEKWIYFGHSTPNIRVQANLSALSDPRSYQGYTCLQPGSRWNDNNPPLERDEAGNLVWGWKPDTDVITAGRWAVLQKKGLVDPGDAGFVFIDSETGDRVLPHSGSVSWNEHRQRWILIFGQLWGTTSVLGEVWYAEALHPEGPWSEARKIVTHDRYSFYNVKQHPYFAKGNYIYFEGTYTQSFSGNDQATPRYDYNQIMYRLNLDDTRLPHIKP
ncbi:MAG: hypothetical protein KDI17_15330 [Halioglobus sp.]|nr:hypothetical protein [Halioglobus sp.]